MGLGESELVGVFLSLQEAQDSHHDQCHHHLVASSGQSGQLFLHPGLVFSFGQDVGPGKSEQIGVLRRPRILDMTSIINILWPHVSFVLLSLVTCRCGSIGVFHCY